MSLHRIISIILCIGSLCHWSQGQIFVNGDLETEKTEWNSIYLPPPWENIPFTDPASKASNQITATSDLVNLEGTSSSSDIGVLGKPLSGLTFISSLDTGSYSSHADSISYWHEGIQQRIDSLMIDSTYSISLYQSVVKQYSAMTEFKTLDSSGSWAIYLDNTLVGITSPSVSNKVFDAVNLDWDFRVLDFKAQATSHVIKFLAHDDDDNTFSSPPYAEGLRMGIDKISISKKEIPKDNKSCFKPYPNPTKAGFIIQLDKIYDNIQLEIIDAVGRNIRLVEYQETERIVANFKLEKGLYYIKLSGDDSFKCIRTLVKH